MGAFIISFPSPWWLVITYGIIGGIACGLTYASVAPPVRLDYLIPFFGINGTSLILAIMT